MSELRKIKERNVNATNRPCPPPTVSQKESIDNFKNLILSEELKPTQVFLDKETFDSFIDNDIKKSEKKNKIKNRLNESI
ncbi:MAG: hypothetical protein M0R17_02755 [Candidatus Omnitrophica bacterium]|jgi:hypothetical protein|nr:hypothetical protein [Candidatus Omnitrophota bacterium]